MQVTLIHLITSLFLNNFYLFMVQCYSLNWSSRVKAKSCQLISCPNTSFIDLYYLRRQSLYLINCFKPDTLTENSFHIFWVPFKRINFNIWEWYVETARPCYYVNSCLTKQLLAQFDFSLKGYASYMYFTVIAAYFLGKKRKSTLSFETW